MAIYFAIRGISNISFTNVRALNTTWSRDPWYWPHCQHCNLTSTVDTIHLAKDLPCNLSSADPTPCYMHPSDSDAKIFNVTMHNVSIEMSGGGQKASTAANAGFQGPDFSGKRVAPSYGLFLRNLCGSFITGLSVSFDENDDRPALILEHCDGVTFSNDVKLERGDGAVFDVGLRDSAGIVLPQHLKSCEYPYEQCGKDLLTHMPEGSSSVPSPVQLREDTNSGMASMKVDGETVALMPVAEYEEVADSGVVRVRIPCIRADHNAACVKRICDPRKHGAKADGASDDTVAIQAAIDSCAKAGGGTVPFSCGGGDGGGKCSFLSFPLRLTGNHTELQLDAGATLKFSDARNDSRWQNTPAALYGTGITDVAVTGAGTIDGSGELWWTQCAGHSLNSSGWSTCGRPGLFTLDPVRNVLISGPTFLNAPCHNIVIRQSKDIEIGHVKVLAPPSYDQMAQSNNTDGIDIDGINYYLHDSEISVGDDLVVVGSNNSLVERMTFGSGRGASISPGCKGDTRSHITNITIRDSTFTRTNRGVRIKTSANSTTATGGHDVHHPGCVGSATNVLYQNLRMVEVNTTISMIMHYPCADVKPGDQCWPLFNSTSMKLDSKHDFPYSQHLAVC